MARGTSTAAPLEMTKWFDASVNPAAVAYLNRLGDLLFILARHVNALQGIAEPLWRPGASTTARADEAICFT